MLTHTYTSTSWETEKYRCFPLSIEAVPAIGRLYVCTGRRKECVSFWNAGPKCTRYIFWSDALTASVDNDWSGFFTM